MTGDEFRSKYQLLKRVTDGGVGTFHAVGPGGAVVMVHVLGTTEQARRTEDALNGLLPIDRARVLDSFEVEGSPVLVTKFVLDFRSLESWLEERTAAARAAGVEPAGPASADVPPRADDSGVSRAGDAPDAGVEAPDRGLPEDSSPPPPGSSSPPPPEDSTPPLAEDSSPSSPEDSSPPLAEPPPASGKRPGALTAAFEALSSPGGDPAATSPGPTGGAPPKPPAADPAAPVDARMAPPRADEPPRPPDPAGPVSAPPPADPPVAPPPEEGAGTGPERGEFTQLFEAFDASTVESRPAVPESSSAPPREPASAPPARPDESSREARDAELGTFRLDPGAEETLGHPEPPEPHPGPEDRRSADPGQPSGAPRPPSRSPQAPPATPLPWEEDLPLADLPANPLDPPPSAPVGDVRATAPFPALEPPPSDEPGATPPRGAPRGPEHAHPPAPPPPASPDDPRAGPQGPGPLTRQFELESSGEGRAAPLERPPDDILGREYARPGGPAGPDPDAAGPLGMGSSSPDGEDDDYLDRLYSGGSSSKEGSGDASSGRVGEAASGARPAVPSPPPPPVQPTGPGEYTRVINSLAAEPPPPPLPPTGVTTETPSKLAQGPSRRVVIGVLIAAVLLALIAVLVFVVARFVTPAVRRLMDEPAEADSLAAPEADPGD